jgi:hypothetical protein
MVAGSETGGVSWYEQGAEPAAGGDWTEHEITASANELEGLNAADIDSDGKVEVFILDQNAGTLEIAKQDGSDATGSWSTTTLDNSAPNIQSSLIADVDDDGNDDILYAYEGDTGGEGGVHWLEWNGSDPTNASNWTKHTALQIEGAWWIGQGRRDLSGDGNATDIVFTTRENKNGAASGSVNWLEPPSDPTNTWTKHQIEDNQDYIPLHCDVGNFYGDGHQKDVVACAGPDGSGTGVYRYRFDNNWSRTQLPNTTTDHNNVVGLDIFGNTRTDIVTLTQAQSPDKLEVREWDGSEYSVSQEFEIDKADDRIVTVPFSTAGIAGVSSGGGPGGERVYWIDLS